MKCRDHASETSLFFAPYIPPNSILTLLKKALHNIACKAFSYASDYIIIDLLVWLKMETHDQNRRRLKQKLITGGQNLLIFLLTNRTFVL